MVLSLLRSAFVVLGCGSVGYFVVVSEATLAVSGPLFKFAAYLGAVSGPSPNGVPGAALATGAIFLPSFLLVFGALPFWDWLRGSVGVRRALTGTNAAVVGILVAALVTPVWTGAIAGPADVLLAGGALLILLSGRVPPVVVVWLCGLAGQALAAVGS